VSRLKTLLTTVEIDVAKRAHNCQGNANHRLEKGDRRLAVKKERGWDYYCMNCGAKILKRDADKIEHTLALIAAGVVTVIEVTEPT
jgi:uncharacterized paraquat-inducible protein A